MHLGCISDVGMLGCQAMYLCVLFRPYGSATRIDIFVEGVGFSPDAGGSVLSLGCPILLQYEAEDLPRYLSYPSIFPGSLYVKL